MGGSRSRKTGRVVLAALVGAYTVGLGLGSSWDAHWHWTVGRDSPWIPPHLLLYAGLVLSGLLGLVMMRTRRDPPALAVTAGAAMLASASVIDMIWHRILGDRLFWSPPHVLFVLGGLVLGMGMAAAFVSAGRAGVISMQTVRWGVRTFGAVLVVACYFGLLPVARLVFYPEAGDKPLLFDPTPMALLGLLSGLMPAAAVLAARAGGRSGNQELILTTAGFWLVQQMFHLALTQPVAAGFGYAVKVTPFIGWQFEVVMFGMTLAPLVLVVLMGDRSPAVAGMLVGALYALEAYLALALTGAPWALTPDVALMSVLVGGVSAGLGAVLAGRVWMWSAVLWPDIAPYPIA